MARPAPAPAPSGPLVGSNNLWASSSEARLRERAQAVKRLVGASLWDALGLDPEAPADREAWEAAVRPLASARLSCPDHTLTGREPHLIRQLDRALGVLADEGLRAYVNTDLRYTSDHLGAGVTLDELRNGAAEAADVLREHAATVIAFGFGNEWDNEADDQHRKDPASTPGRVDFYASAARTVAGVVRGVVPLAGPAHGWAFDGLGGELLLGGVGDVEGLADLYRDGTYRYFDVHRYDGPSAFGVPYTTGKGGSRVTRDLDAEGPLVMRRDFAAEFDAVLAEHGIAPHAVRRIVGEWNVNGDLFDAQHPARKGEAAAVLLASFAADPRVAAAYVHSMWAPARQAKYAVAEGGPVALAIGRFALNRFAATRHQERSRERAR